MVTRRSFEGFHLLDKQLAAAERLGWHAHATANLTLVLGGSYEEEFGHGSQRCPAWSLQYKPVGIPHTTAPRRGGVRMLVLSCDRRVVSGRPLGSARRASLGPGGVAAAVALRLFQAAFGDGARSQAQLGALASRLVDATEEQLETTPAGQPPTWLTEAAERVRALDPAARGLSALARLVRVHPVYLARMFRRHYGRSVGSQLRRCRANRAVELLSRRNMPLGLLAAELGYYDQSHFSTDFRRETGYTPGAFRRETRRLGLSRVS